MQTLPILPSLNATPAPATPPRSSDGDGADQQFTQMLSRQISERDASTSATRQVEHSKPVAVKPDQPAQSNATQNSACKVSDAESPADQAKPTESANGTDAKTATVDKVSSKDKPITADQTVAGSSTDAALTASAAIMALVANAGPGAAKPSVATTDTAVVDPSRITAARPDGSDRLDFRTVPAVTSRENAAIEFASKTSAQFGTALQASAQGTPDGAITASKIPDALIASIPDGANVVPQLPPTALNIALPAGALPVNILAPRVGADGWNQSLGQRMVWMVAGTEQSASLTLNPPDLGPLQVVLHVSNGQANASFYSAQPEVRQALEAALPRLREMLGDAGVTLGQASVSAGNPQQNGTSNQNASSGSRRTDTSTVENTSVVSTGRRFSSGNGLVDTFA